MPYAPARACPCGGRITKGQCDRCSKGKRARDTRPNFRQRGYSWEWSKYSLRFRQQNPLCAECLANGLVVAATCVDHIVPHRGDAELFWDTENHRSLCDSCHGRKSARERL